MSDNGKNTTLFPGQPVPILGQPFTVLDVTIPVNAKVRCNCGGGADAVVVILASVAAGCPSCGRLYNVAFNPATGQIVVGVNSLESDKVPS